MSAELELRPLQAAALEKVRAAWVGGAKNVLIQAPTGMGKTECAVAMLQATYANGQRGAFVCDRISLVDQTSARFDKYNLPHGVVQADHWRWRPHDQIQVCSVQTLLRRSWPDAALLVVDECHVLGRSVRRKLEARDCYAVGLTATPFTRGLGRYFDTVINAATTNQLIDDGWLSPFRIFAASEPDMTGVKVDKGEWVDAEAEQRVLPVVGDCVAEYLNKGAGRKFIAFAVNVAHAEELQRQFMAAGVIVNLYTYRQNDAERQASIEEFRKPDSYIRGLLSVESLTRGFDVADIGVVILARPLRKSLATFVQMVGRGLRRAPGKDEVTILDHSGNCMRFWDAWMAYMEVGVTELDDGEKKEQQKPPERGEVEPPVKCPKCKHIHRRRSSCPSCGHEYPKKRSAIKHDSGELVELVGGAKPGEERQALYSQLVQIAKERGYDTGWSAHKFKERTGAWPRGLAPEPAEPTTALRNWIKSRQIAWAKAKAKGVAA